MIGLYEQERAYKVTVDAQTKRIASIEPIVENQYGYVAELSLFVGKTRHEIACMQGDDLKTDAQTSATITNTALRDMLTEGFDYIAGEMKGGANG